MSAKTMVPKPTLLDKVVGYFSPSAGLDRMRSRTTMATAGGYKGGHVSWTAECKCHWDETDTSGQGAMTIGASVTLHLHPEGATSGDVDMTGTATVTGKSQSVPLRGVVEQSFTLTGNGALTIGTVS